MNTNTNIPGKGAEAHQAGEKMMCEPQQLHVPDGVEAGVIHGLGISAFRRGKLETALKFVGLSCAHPDAPAIWHRDHAEILDQCGLSEEAEAAARLAVARDPDLAEAWETLGTILVQRNRLEEGCACYEKAVGIKPEFAEALNNLAVTLNLLGRNRAALVRYQQVCRLLPENLEIQLNFATLLGELNRHREGLEIVLKVAGRHRNSSRARSIAEEFRAKLKRQANQERKKNTSAPCALASL